MLCFIFAHGAESHAFREFFHPLESLESTMPGLYKNEEVFILITKEGLSNSMCKLSYLLGKFPQIKEVINAGVCGALNSKLEIGSVVDISSVYQYNGEDFEFKSFHSEQTPLAYSCMSAPHRIVTSKEANMLSAYGDVVDRELWGIAYACKQAKIPWSSFKLISDNARENVCDIVLEKATDYSNLLLKHYLKRNPSLGLKRKQIIELPEGFYFSFSQKKIWEKYSQIGSVKKIYPSQEELHRLREEISFPKERTSKLLSLWERKLFPQQYKIKKKTEQSLSILKRNGVHSHYDPQLENQYLDLKLHIKNQNDLKKALYALEHFDYKQFVESLTGAENV